MIKVGVGRVRDEIDGIYKRENIGGIGEKGKVENDWNGEIVV